MNQLLKQLFPEQINNDYQGSLFAKWMFVVFTIMTVSRSLIHMLTYDGGAQSIASIPLDTYGHAASATVILMFALWGLSQLLMGILYIVALWRYQRLIPMFYLLMFFEYCMRVVLFHVKPIVTLHVAPGATLDKFMIPASLLFFFLSVRKRKEAKDKI